MALYFGWAGDWANYSVAGVEGRGTVYDFLVALNPGIFVPNLGYNLRIQPGYLGVDLFPPTQVWNTNATLAIRPDTTTPGSVLNYIVEAPKNSINAKDYVLGPAKGNLGANALIYFEVG